MYTDLNTEHTLKEINLDSDKLILEDTSSWLIYDGYRDIIKSWNPGEMISIKKSRDPDYPYKLINIHHNKAVEAKYIS